MTEPVARFVVLGASGLIGQTVGEALAQDGFAVTAVARRFTAAQTAAFGPKAVTCPMADLDPDALARLLSEHRPTSFSTASASFRTVRAGRRRMCTLPSWPDCFERSEHKAGRCS